MYSRENSRFVETENTIEKLLSTLNVSFNFAPANDKFPSTVLPKGWNGIHPHEFVNVQIMGKFIGSIFTVHPLILKNYKMKGHLTLAVIDITDLESREMKDKTKYQPIPKFPSSFFDVTVVMAKDAPAASAVTALNALKVKEIKNKSLVSIFMIDEMKKAVTVRTVFEDSEKTLAPETIKSLEQNVIQALEKAGFPLRA
jgi:phenylalanyl-tRNA synthetase beta chain